MQEYLAIGKEWVCGGWMPVILWVYDDACMSTNILPDDYMLTQQFWDEAKFKDEDKSRKLKDLRIKDVVVIRRKE